MNVKVILLKRKILSALGCLAAAAAIFYVVNFPPAVGAAATARQLPIYCVQRDQKLVAISFDAAWGNEDTEQLIEILGNYKVKATFFVVGEWVDKYPHSVKALHDAGHEVMNHSNTHAHYPQLTADEVVADLNACNDKIEAVTGVRPTLVRLPYGDYDNNSINAVRSIGMEPIQWDVEVMATTERPEKSVSFFPDAHRFVRGGMNMEIKHTHPEYETPEQREDALKDAKQAAVGAIAALRGNVHKYSA